ncbi:methyltransferase domain-containing protein [Nocardia sp. NPDC005366]|uniref:class I SAM-dependent methyltransferase n=1 Tax=Nocardia sp. NPDC005366 TaxID=3156878 RepID=UPI0033BA94E3
MSANPLATAESWDLAAEDYAEFAPAITRPFSARALELAGLTPTSRIIDVAAGTGSLSLSAAGQVASVHAIDFSASMLARLRDGAGAAGFANVETVVADGQALPFEDDRFDAAFSMFGLMFFPDRAKGFAELYRVLRPGGVAVVSSWAPIADSPLMMKMFAACAAADPELQEPQPDFLGLENPEVFASEMLAVGFVGVTIQRHSTSLVFDSAGHLWDTMVLSSAAMQMVRRADGEKLWDERAKAMRDYLSANYRPNSPLSTTAFLGIAHKPRGSAE